MSNPNFDSVLPDYWEVGRDSDPVPPELLLGGPRFHCRLDGTRVWALQDAVAHGEHFHAKTTAGIARPDDGMLRREALDQAARVATGRETQQQLVQRAQAFEAFLRGDPISAARESTEGDGGAPDDLHALLDFVWARTSLESSGYVSLAGHEAQAEAESYFGDYGVELLRIVRHVLTVTGSVAKSVEGKRP